MNINPIADSIIAIKPAYSEIIRFYQQIFQLQEDYAAKANPILPEISDSAATDAVLHDRPLLTRSDFSIDLPNATALLSEICRVQGNSLINQQFSQINQAISNRDIDPEKLFKALLHTTPDAFLEAEERAQISAEVLEFAVRQSIQPSVSRISAHAATIFAAERQPGKGYCPVCGEPPSLSVLRENGKRSLICEFCRHEWPIIRIYCPWCENTDQHTMSYLTVESEAYYRVNICEKCRFYIKTIIIENLPYAFHPGFEISATLHLDIIAKDQGFMPGIDEVPGLGYSAS